jgi:hypothetical protein
MASPVIVHKCDSHHMTPLYRTTLVLIHATAAFVAENSGAWPVKAVSTCTLTGTIVRPFRKDQQNR